MIHIIKYSTLNYHTTVLQASLASNDYNNDKNYNIFIAPKK